MNKPLDPQAGWEPCGDERAADALARLVGEAPQVFSTASLTSARSARLPFYDDYRLLELELVRDGRRERAFALDGSDETRWLDGNSAAIHDTNAAESLVLTDATVHDYLRFFFYFVRGDSGTFVLIESPSEVSVDEDADGSVAGNGAAGADDVAAELQERLALVRSRTAPLTTRSTDEHGRWVIDALVAYDDTCFAATLAVEAGGEVEMVDDEPVATLDGLTLPDYLSLELVNERHVDAELPRDRDVTETIVAVLLEDAIRERDAEALDGNMLLRHFNTETESGNPVGRLTRLVSSSQPVLIIESDIPFVEDFVAGLIDGPDEVVTGGAIARAGVVEGPQGLRCAIEYENSTVKLHLLSFHAYRELFDSERTAHELALRDAAVLIGCERAADVPEPLRRIADLVLTFPRIDRRRFSRIFERVFQAKPTPGWDAPGSDWTRYLVPADFHVPRRLSLSPDNAVLFMKKRVEARLKQVLPDTGPSLSELHGMGEARQICEDLISDIRSAQADQIPWSAVDRGLLLVGAPGTGKTSLARAVAKESGIKFVIASAAAWQSAGYLDSHLRAMRADFAEARRYAPAILFIDELDSIGSREKLGGQENSVYQTDVINALLEQIQGIVTIDPVIVIGATNYPENVDPALRRAGRLDQMVELPLPNIAALEKIFNYYLKPYRAAREVASGVKTRALAELSFGLTGADVEFFVRGAARRARRANRKIKQEDLFAEITRRPRRPDSAPQVGPEEMRRTAVHEAGHAVARLISSTHGNDVTFVTIVPRMDGTLGFVASMPLDGQVSTRRTMLEELETVLGGRAAEEVVFGADGIGGGAGGESRSSDLATATRLAELYVCKSGLGDGGALHWTEQPTPAQEKQIEALLDRSYSSIVARLEANRPLLDRIVAILEEKQELSGAELRKLVASESAATSSAA